MSTGPDSASARKRRARTLPRAGKRWRYHGGSRLCLHWQGCPALQLRFNALIDASFRVLGRDADGVLDRVRVRAAVADDAHALHAQQGRSAVLGIIEAAL